MRIAFDAKRLYNNFTGLGNYSRTMIDILTKFFPENEYLLLTPKVRRNTVTTPYLNHKGCHTLMPQSNVYGSLWRTFCQASIAAKHGATIYHGLSNELPTGLHRHGIRSVVTIHDVAFRTFPDMYHWHDRLIYEQKWRYACKNADHIIAISESTKRDVLRFYNVPEEKVSVIYQPVNDIFYHPMQNPRPVAEKAIPALPERYMLYVGSINSRKNLLNIVKALALIPSNNRIPLVVIGDGHEYKQKVQAYIHAHQLEEHVIFAGTSINTQNLQALYQCATLFVYPSFYEGFGLPVVEASLCSCPVITSNTSSLPEAAGPDAMTADPNDYEELSQMMGQLLTSPTLRESTARKGFEYAHRMFAPKTLSEQLQQVYTKLST